MRLDRVVARALTTACQEQRRRDLRMVVLDRVQRREHEKFKERWRKRRTVGRHA